MSNDIQASTDAFLTPAERVEKGKALRKSCPRSSHAVWLPAVNRPDPVSLLMEANKGRARKLLPMKFDRMKTNAFVFYRGAASLMAADLSGTPNSGIRVQICGDAHVKNLGTYATPDGRLVFDVNDFDETITAPWEWDLKRLAVSMLLAGAEADDKPADCKKAVREFVAAYRDAMKLFSTMKVLDLMQYEILNSGIQKDSFVTRVLKKAERVTPEKNLEKLTEPSEDGWRKFKESNVVTHVTPDSKQAILDALPEYISRLGAARRLTIKSYSPHDVAFKIVGTGSVGTLDYIVLLFGNGPNDPLFLQVKQAMPSCYAKYLPDVPPAEHEGQRVADGQYCLQTVTDPFVGWTTINGKHFVVRQLADHKASVEPAELTGDILMEYGVICGKLLARAHARTGDAAMISGYCGASDLFDRAIADFAVAYAAQTNKDFAAFKTVSNDELLKRVPEE
ncbi:MAG: DUF2252 domain-containing protein [Planctomycetota bacterium]